MGYSRGISLNAPARLVGWVAFPQRRTLRPSRYRDMPNVTAGKRGQDHVSHWAEGMIPGQEASNFPDTHENIRLEKQYIGSKIQKKMAK